MANDETILLTVSITPLEQEIIREVNETRALRNRSLAVRQIIREWQVLQAERERLQAARDAAVKKLLETEAKHVAQN